MSDSPKVQPGNRRAGSRIGTDSAVPRPAARPPRSSGGSTSRLRRFVTRRTYDRLLEAFRAAPGNVSHAARKAVVHRQTAKRAWERGWPDRGFDPCREVVESEQLAARARLQTLREVEIKALAKRKSADDINAARAAHDDAVKQRAREAEMVRASSYTAHEMLRLSLKMLQNGRTLGDRVTRALEKQDVPLSQVRGLTAAIARLGRLSVEAAKMAQEMEHRVLGQPDRWIGIDVANMTPEEAAHEIEMANRALARYRRKQERQAKNAITTSGESLSRSQERTSP